MGSKKEKIIYMDQKGYQMYLNEIEDLKLKLSEINKGRRDAFDAGAGDGWDSPEFEEIERNSRMIEGEINRRMASLSFIEIVESMSQEDLIDLNDIVKLNIIFAENDTEEMIVKLVGNISKKFEEEGITEISVNSPLGSAIYGKKVGEMTPYTVNANTFNVEIMEKMKKEKQNGYTRKLKR